MMHAYDRIYLERARSVLARMFDFVVYDLKYSLADFFDLFTKTSIATRFESGDFSIIVGKSGVEVAYEVLEELSIKYERIVPRYTANRSEEYWTGWALAYYQWETRLRFEEICRYVPIHYVKALYYPYHEMDIRQFVDKMNEMYKEAKPYTNLKLRRRYAGLSQKEISLATGIPIRTIQQYEQRQKDINKAQVGYLLQLSKTLCCDIECLLEKV